MTFTRFLVFLDIPCDLLPFVETAFRDEIVFACCLEFDFLDELSNKLIDSLLVSVISKNIEYCTNTSIDADYAILFKSCLFILLVLNLELLALLVQLFLQLDAELLELLRDCCKDVRLQVAHINVDLMNLGRELVASLVQGSG